MFGKRKQEPKIETVSFEAILKDFDERWEATKLTRPTHFGDGRPFEPDPLVAELRDAYWRSIHLPDAQAAAEHGVFVLLMATLHDPKAEEVDSSFLPVWESHVLRLRASMIGRKAVEDERTVSRFADYLMEYWRSKGVVDVDTAATIDAMVASHDRHR